MYQTIAAGVAFALILPGIAMAFVPMLPALSYMFVVSLLFSLTTRFQTVSGTEISVLLVLTLISIAIDHLSGLLGAKWGGAHAKSLFWGFVGGILGTMALPVVGSFAGLFIGVFASEMYFKNKQEAALRAAGSALLGSLSGVVANICIAVIFSGLFFYFAFF